MADLPRYQTMGVQVADLPRISTAPQQVAAQGFSSLAQNLDRMLSYAEDVATTEAKKAGAKYAVENPLTKSQIEQAVATPKKLKVKGGGDVFQQSYENTMASQLSSDLLLDADVELKDIENRFQMGLLSKDKAKERFTDLLDGQSALMVGVSPEFSVKHRAALAATASTSYKKILDIEMKTYMGIEKSKLEVSIQQLPSVMEDIIKYQTGTIDPETNKVVDINQLINAKVSQYADSIKKLNGDNTYFVKALEIAREAKVSSVTSYLTDKKLTSSPSKALEMIASGNMGPLSSIYKGLNDADRDKIETSVLKKFGDVERARQIDEARVAKGNESYAINQRDLFYRGEIDENTLISRLKSVNQLKPEELKVIRTEGRPANQEVFGRLESMAVKGNISEADLDKKAEAGEISWKQRNDLSRIVRDKNTPMGKARQYVDSSLGVPDPLTPGFRNERKRAAEVKAALQLEEEEALQLNKPFNPVKRAQELVKSRQQEDDVKMDETVRKDLKRLLEEDGVKYSEDYTDDDLKAIGIKSPDRRKKIMNKIKALKGDE
jgi:hypothetical protein